MICLMPNCCFLSETSRMLEIYRALRQHGDSAADAPGATAIAAAPSKPTTPPTTAHRRITHNEIDGRESIFSPPNPTSTTILNPHRARSPDLQNDLYSLGT